KLESGPDSKLKSGLDAIVIRKPTDPQSPEAAAAWERFQVAAENARALVHAALLTDDIKAVRQAIVRNRAAGLVNVPPQAEMQRLETKVRTAGFSTNVITPPAGVANVLNGVATVDNYLEQV